MGNHDVKALSAWQKIKTDGGRKISSPGRLLALNGNRLPRAFEPVGEIKMLKSKGTVELNRNRFRVRNIRSNVLPKRHRALYLKITAVLGLSGYLDFGLILSL